jgi:uncharacterized protein
MLELGRMNRLRAVRMTPPGMFLADDEGDEVLLPNKYVPDWLGEADTISVFVYTDSHDRIVATTLTPTIQRGQFGLLRVKSVTDYGAFLDWGVERDVFVPFREQHRPMQTESQYVVYLYLDEATNRLVASSKLNKFFDDDPADLEEGQRVDLLVYERTDLGLNVVIDNRWRGLIFANEIFQPLQPGERTVGYVKQIRHDDRIDVSLQAVGQDALEPNAERILAALDARDGYLPLTDASEPHQIYAELEMSKKAFKRAVGVLYKARRIELEPNGIHRIG